MERKTGGASSLGSDWGQWVNSVGWISHSAHFGLNLIYKLHEQIPMLIFLKPISSWKFPLIPAETTQALVCGFHPRRTGAGERGAPWVQFWKTHCCGPVVLDNCITLNLMGQIAEADLVDYHWLSRFKAHLSFLFWSEYILYVTFLFYLTLTAVIWVNNKPHHICTATNLLQTEKL